MMTEQSRRPDEEAQSFVVRVWSEGPGQWRGRVSHVQGDVQQGFTRLSQAVLFMERRVGGYRREPAAEYEPRPAGKRPLQMTRLTGRAMRLAAVAATLVVLAIGVTLLSGLSGGGRLAGTASGGSLDVEPVLAFLAGAVAGGAAVRVLLRRRCH